MGPKRDLRQVPYLFSQQVGFLGKWIALKISVDEIATGSVSRRDMEKISIRRSFGEGHFVRIP